MEFVTFAALLGGLVAGFLPGLAVGWHASPTLVRLVEHEGELHARDNEMVVVSSGGWVDRADG
jgi:hypothetical protein